MWRRGLIKRNILASTKTLFCYGLEQVYLLIPQTWYTWLQYHPKPNALVRAPKVPMNIIALRVKGLKHAKNT